MADVPTTKRTITVKTKYASVQNVGSDSVFDFSDVGTICFDLVICGFFGPAVDPQSVVQTVLFVTPFELLLHIFNDDMGLMVNSGKSLS